MSLIRWSQRPVSPTLGSLPLIETLWTGILLARQLAIIDRNRWLFSPEGALITFPPDRCLTTASGEDGHHTDAGRMPMHYLLFYDVVPDYSERRRPFRKAHLEYARQSVARGELVLGGGFANPDDGAVLLFRGSTPAVAEGFAATDPYVVHGVVMNWRVRKWTTVVGADAKVPVPDEGP